MADDPCWQYSVLVIKNPDLAKFEKQLERYGRAGWELVTSLTTVKFIGRAMGNDLVFVFKRPGEGPADRTVGVGMQAYDPGTGMLIDDVEG